MTAPLPRQDRRRSAGDTQSLRLGARHRRVGTDWITETAAGATAIVALDREVAVRNVDPGVAGQVVFGPGEGTDVAAGVAPSGPVVWGDARRNAFIERTTLP